MVRRYALRDDPWERIKDLLPGREDTAGARAQDNRLFVEAGRRRWAERGVWEKVFKHLIQDADNEYAMIDSTIVRAHQHSAGARREKKGPRMKRSGAQQAGYAPKSTPCATRLATQRAFASRRGKRMMCRALTRFCRR